LAIYKVGKVLLPTEFFSVAKAPGKAPSLAPEPSALTPKADKEKPSSADSSDSSSQVKPSNDSSGTVKINANGKWLSLVLGLGIVILTSLTA
ncbi:fasciclin-like arabinogalactan protein, partial [Trifolium medium]|nr:fasciclin-like arabinogalactan protein [Trifolium medium]